MIASVERLGRDSNGSSVFHYSFLFFEFLIKSIISVLG